MRYGTRTHARKRWTRRGRRPVCKVKIGYEWGYLYTAICPYTGDVFACLLSHLDKSCFDVFLEQFKNHLTGKNIEAKQVLLIGDGAGAHQKALVEKQGMKWVKLPTACPELNPVERFFEELRKYTSNIIFEDLTQIEDFLEKLVREYIYNPEAVSQLTLFSYLNT